MQPKVTLLAFTDHPIQTIYRIWEASKSNTPMEEIDKKANCVEAYEIFKKVIDSKIPVAENLDFVFLLENVSVSFREQMVRHRIGVHVGERIGIDMVPDLADSTWWSQSMRILDMSKFADERAYREPKFPNHLAEYEWRNAMTNAQNSYKALLRHGMVMEDARDVIPFGATHRITWKLNLAALQHIIGKRGCQILQGDLWEPIIRGMVEELATKVDQHFRTLIAPPCIKGGEYVGCCFKLDNERRVRGEDLIPPCTLYAGRELTTVEFDKFAKTERFQKMADQYESLWGKDPYTYR